MNDALVLINTYGVEQISCGSSSSQRQQTLCLWREGAKGTCWQNKYVYKINNNKSRDCTKSRLIIINGFSSYHLNHVTIFDLVSIDLVRACAAAVWMQNTGVMPPPALAWLAGPLSTGLQPHTLLQVLELDFAISLFSRLSTCPFIHCLFSSSQTLSSSLSTTPSRNPNYFHNGESQCTATGGNTAPLLVHQTPSSCFY